MNREIYSEIQYSLSNRSYRFVSVGKHGEIPKIVIFQKVEENYFNLFLSDFVNNAIGDDRGVTDNGDLPKVMATVIQIIGLFLDRYARASILITGSDSIRKRLYARIIHNHYEELSAIYEVQCTEASGLAYKPYFVSDKEYVPYSFLIRLKMD